MIKARITGVRNSPFCPVMARAHFSENNYFQLWCTQVVSHAARQHEEKTCLRDRSHSTEHRPLQTGRLDSDWG